MVAVGLAEHSPSTSINSVFAKCCLNNEVERSRVVVIFENIIETNTNSNELLAEKCLLLLKLLSIDFIYFLMSHYFPINFDRDLSRLSP